MCHSPPGSGPGSRRFSKIVDRCARYSVYTDPLSRHAARLALLRPPAIRLAAELTNNIAPAMQRHSRMRSWGGCDATAPGPTVAGASGGDGRGCPDLAWPSGPGQGSGTGSEAVKAFARTERFAIMAVRLRLPAAKFPSEPMRDPSVQALYRQHLHGGRPPATSPGTRRPLAARAVQPTACRPADCSRSPLIRSSAHPLIPLASSPVARIKYI